MSVRKYDFPEPKEQLTKIMNLSTTLGEQKLKSQFNLQNREIRAATLANKIVSFSVDIARYTRGASAHPEKKEHFQRLERVTKAAINGWATYSYREYGRATLVEAKEMLADVDWSIAPDIQVPNVCLEVPYGGTEIAYVDFHEQVSPDRVELIA